MRLSRLLQRAGAKGAASVALFVSLICSAYANTAAQVNVYGVDTVRNADGHFEARYHFQRRFASNDPIYPGKVDYVSKTVKIEKRGNPMNWVKRTGLEVAVIGAVAAAGYAIDELTQQVTAPVEVTDSNAFYNPGYGYKLHGTQDYVSDFYVALWHYIDSVGFTDVVLKGSPYNQGSTTYIRAEWRTASGYFRDSTLGLGFEACAECEIPKVIEMQPVPDSDVWRIIDPIADAHPEYLKDWAKDPSGNPYIYPEIPPIQEGIVNGTPGASPDAVPVTGAQPLPPAVVVEDPLAGQGLAPDGTPTGDPAPTPEVAKDDAPLEIPDDYAREDTLKNISELVRELKDFFQEDIEEEPDLEGDNNPADIYNDLSDKFDSLPDMPTMGFEPDLGVDYSGSCQTINFSWNGANQIFPTDSQCAKMNVAKQMLAWFLFIVTMFAVIYIIMGARRFN